MRKTDWLETIIKTDDDCNITFRRDGEIVTLEVTTWDGIRMIKKRTLSNKEKEWIIQVLS
jgi:hypothetical protein